MLTAPNRRRNDNEANDEPATAHVLLVDDDENFSSWLSLLMRRLGFTVETANNGAEALAILRSGAAFDLLICDYEMPRMNGFDLIRVIRSNDAIAHQYAVMLTSHENLESKIAALTIGYDDFLPKSCTEVEVVAKVVAAKRMVARQKQLAASAREWQTLATRDELTGVATRRTLYAEAERHLAEGRHIGVAILDLDDFKPVNDTYGHLAGDRILRDIGALFLARTRASDFIARYGGDEFLLLVIGGTLDDIRGAAERLSGEIETLQWRSGDATFGVRATHGFAHSSLIANVTLEGLLDVADRDLYAKKWLKKSPGQSADLYRYSRDGGTVVSMPAAELKP